jgi:DNA replication protein DnaC
MSIKELIKINQEQLKEIQDTPIRKVFKISPGDWKELFTLKANKILAKRKRTLDVDKDNKNVINQLYFWTTGNEKFSGDLDKGIVLTGAYGCGKTVLMQSFVDTFNDLSHGKMSESELRKSLDKYQHIKSYHAKILVNLIINNGIESYVKRAMFIDELGKETKSATDYGTKVLPIIDLLTLRYNENSLTFGTANYSRKTLGTKEFYGETIGERMIELFNFIELPGKSRRK